MTAHFPKMRERLPMTQDCIFCKIVAGEIPAQVVYEDEMVLAFDDVSPMMPVHTLIVPKAHYANIADNIPEDLMGHLFATVRKVAELKGIDKSGFRVVVNTGDHACQTVHHIHIHVLGGGQMNDGSPAM